MTADRPPMRQARMFAVIVWVDRDVDRADAHRLASDLERCIENEIASFNEAFEHRAWAERV